MEIEYFWGIFAIWGITFFCGVILRNDYYVYFSLGIFMGLLILSIMELIGEVLEVLKEKGKMINKVKRRLK